MADQKSDGRGDKGGNEAMAGLRVRRSVYKAAWRLCHRTRANWRRRSSGPRPQRGVGGRLPALGFREDGEDGEERERWSEVMECISFYDAGGQDADLTIIAHGRWRAGVKAKIKKKQD